MSKLKVFSVCTGVGGLDEPFHKDKDFEVVGFAEIDEPCIQVLRKHFPHIKNFGDISELKKSKIPDHNVLIGGTPCQSFSESGNRKGFEGKSGLFVEFVKILKAKKPRYFIHENVRGMFNSGYGWDFARVQIELAKAGYSFRWELLNAREFGVPQNRERVFTIGILRGQGSREVLCEAKSSGKNVKEKKRNTKNGQGFLKDNAQDVIAYSKSHREEHIDHRIRINDTANTLTTGKGCTTMSSATLVKDHKGKLRNFVPVECERLMGWPVNWTKWGIDKDGNKVAISEDNRYGMCGNGVVSNKPRAVKSLIKKNEKKLKEKNR